MQAEPVDERQQMITALTMQDAVIAGADAHPYRQTPTRDLRVHVMAAAGAVAPAPAVVLFHGGGWTYGSPLFVRPHAEGFARMGVTVALPEYRVAHRDGTSITDAVDDATAAVAWVRSEGERLGIDTRRIVLAGSSAGAHLALMVAAESPDPARALVLWNTPCDLADVPIGAALDPEVRRRLSPITHVRRADSFPPVLLLHGENDDTVPPAGAARFAAAVRSAGGDVRLLTFAGGHGFERPQHDSGAAMATCLGAAAELMAASGALP